MLFNKQDVEAVYELGEKLAELVYWSLHNETELKEEERVSLKF